MDIFLNPEEGMGPADGVRGGGVPPAAPGGGQVGPPPPNSHQSPDGGNLGSLEEQEEEDDRDMSPLHVWDDELETWVVYESDQDGEGDGGTGDIGNPPNVGSDNGDGGDNGDPPAPRTSGKVNRGVPATRNDDVPELAAEIMSPPTVAMDLEGVKGAEWVVAMEAELDSLWENNVYEEVPRGRKVIETKWVLRVKTNAVGNLDKYKARVVEKGFRQVEGLDDDETYAPTVHFESVRVV